MSRVSKSVLCTVVQCIILMSCLPSAMSYNYGYANPDFGSFQPFQYPSYIDDADGFVPGRYPTLRQGFSQFQGEPLFGLGQYSQNAARSPDPGFGMGGFYGGFGPLQYQSSLISGNDEPKIGMRSTYDPYSQNLDFLQGKTGRFGGYDAYGGFGQLSSLGSTPRQQSFPKANPYASLGGYGTPSNLFASPVGSRFGGIELMGSFGPVEEGLAGLGESGADAPLAARYGYPGLANKRFGELFGGYGGQAEQGLSGEQGQASSRSPRLPISGFASPASGFGGTNFLGSPGSFQIPFLRSAPDQDLQSLFNDDSSNSD